MPSVRGIMVQIMAEVDSRVFPEFPCPQSTQSKISETKHHGAGPSMISSSKADRILGRDPITSVYIPSIPDLRFSVKYTIEHVPVKGRYWYFKLIMNGRDVTSWGIDPANNPRGVVARGLFEPRSWDIEENGQILKHTGTEARPFLFSSKQAECAAQDGGYIEVRVMRSSGRVRVAPILGSHRPQNAYGLLLPPGPLVKNPNDMKYYDWILIDSKDAPYATFRFHYRCWDFLNKLQLAPKEHRRALLKPSNSSFLLNKLLAPRPVILRADEKSKDDHKYDNKGDKPKDQHVEAEMELSNLMRRSTSLNAGTRKPRRAAGLVFEQNEAGFVAHYRPTFPAKSPGHNGICALRNDKSPMHRVPSGRDTSKIQRELPMPISSFKALPKATLDEWTAGRPLPLPPRISSLGHARVSSRNSLPRSITDSVADGDDPNSDDEGIRHASEVRMYRGSPIEVKESVALADYGGHDLHHSSTIQLDTVLSAAKPDAADSLQCQLQFSYNSLPRSHNPPGDDVFADRPSYSRDRRNGNMSFLSSSTSCNRSAPPPQPIFTPPSLKVPGSPQLMPNFSRNIANSKLTPPPEGWFSPPNVPLCNNPHIATYLRSFGEEESHSWGQGLDFTKEQLRLVSSDAESINSNFDEPAGVKNDHPHTKEERSSSPWGWLTGSVGSYGLTSRQRFLASRARSRIDSGVVIGVENRTKMDNWKKVGVVDNEEPRKKMVTFADDDIFSHKSPPMLGHFPPGKCSDEQPVGNWI